MSSFASLLTSFRSRSVSLLLSLRLPSQPPPSSIHLFTPFALQPNRQHHNVFKTVYTMNVAYFRWKQSDPQVHINFRYVNAEQQLDRVFNLSRSIDEPVTACMQRIQSNLRKELDKKQRRTKKPKRPQQSSDEPVVAVVEPVDESLADVKLLNLSGGELSPSATMLDVFGQQAAGISTDVAMVIFDQRFGIAYNLPWVHGIALPTSILAGYFVYPTRLELDGCDAHGADFEWFVADSAATPTATTVWHPIGNAYQWLVTDACIGRHLKVRCTPKRQHLSGPAVEAVTKSPVLPPPPGECHYVRRHRHTTERLADRSFRIVSYNLLADYYADSDYSRAELFPYIPAAALHIDYRKQLFVRELHGYRADVMCLQEVDAKIFDHDLVPVFGFGSYAGHMQKKGSTAEGVATFYRTDRFELIETTGINIGESLDQLDCMHELRDAIAANAQLAERMRARSTTVQVTVLRSREAPSKWLCIGNTHLYFHPDADHIRLLQSAAAMRYVESVRSRLLVDRPQQKAADVSVVLCGDFNSTPECGVHRLMTSGVVPAGFVDFESNADEALPNVELRQPFRMRSAYGPIPFTNYTVGFTECIDYIFYQTDDLTVRQTVPTPDEQQLSEHTAIPSVVHPSDHVALVADFEWRTDVK